MLDNGSSPRGRGKLELDNFEKKYSRLIPAWAGKTRPGLANLPRAEAHPRVGGENTTKKRSTPIKTGSSPRGRGKRRHGR